MAYDVIHNITRKTQRHEVVQPSGTAIEQHRTTYDWAYVYGGSQPHAPTQIGSQDGGVGPVVGRTFRYDANGNQASWDHDQNGTRRTLVWDDVQDGQVSWEARTPGATDENRLQSLFDNGHEKAYVYDDAGQRVIKRGPQGETVYVNQWFTMRNGQAGTKHVFAGTERIVSKLMKQDGPGANPKGKTPFEKDLYYFHPDHLGSSAYVTDAKAKLYQHLEYFPFGETWVEEVSNTQRTPYWYTAKELDEETGLYYYGARYYDPRTSVWQSADPILGDYLNGQPNSGVYDSINLALYHYGALNPLRYRDPDGLANEDQTEKGWFAKWVGQTVRDVRGGVQADRAAREAEALGEDPEQARQWAMERVAESSKANEEVAQGMQDSVEEGAIAILGTKGLGRFFGGLFNTTRHITEKLDNVLKPGGQLIGYVRKGATPEIRTVSGQQFSDVKEALMKMGAKPGSRAGYQGQWYELKGGGGFGIRQSKGSGETIDFDLENYGFEKGLKLHQEL